MKNIYAALAILTLPILNSFAAEKGVPEWKGIFGNLKTIAICAPARPAKSSQVDKALEKLREAGYNVKVMPNARKNENSGKLVAADLRAADFMQAYMDKEVDAIWCVRGGVGSIDTAKLLDWEKLRSRRIPVVGFSDITSLHNVMMKNKVGHIFSGPSLTQMLSCDKKSVEWFGRTIAGGRHPAIQLQIVSNGKACSGYPAGGHLTLYQRAYCSGNAPASDGKIVFLETPNNPQKLAANELEQLRKKGCFDRCAAVVFGNVKGRKEVIDRIINEFAAKVKCPVFRGLPYGHQSSNYLIDFEREVSITAEG
ncbi:MAG: LD-carboxypeptidase, partial [Lentisphaeria bacterium]|nr:LD-carboxypeptidase [Lentisphaeria bacterium]